MILSWEEEASHYPYFLYGELQTENLVPQDT